MPETKKRDGGVVVSVGAMRAVDCRPSPLGQVRLQAASQLLQAGEGDEVAALPGDGRIGDMGPLPVAFYAGASRWPDFILST